MVNDIFFCASPIKKLEYQAVRPFDVAKTLNCVKDIQLVLDVATRDGSGDVLS